MIVYKPTARYGDVITDLTSAITKAKQEYDYWVAQANAAKTTAQGLIQNLQDPANAIEYISLDTTYLPRIEIDKPLAPSPPGAVDPVLQFLKPKVTLKIRNMNSISVAKYGEPGETRWPTVAVIGAAGIAALTYLVFRGIFK